MVRLRRHDRCVRFVWEQSTRVDDGIARFMAIGGHGSRAIIGRHMRELAGLAVGCLYTIGSVNSPVITVEA